MHESPLDVVISDKIRMVEDGNVDHFLEVQVLDGMHEGALITLACSQPQFLQAIHGATYRVSVARLEHAHKDSAELLRDSDQSVSYRISELQLLDVDELRELQMAENEEATWQN